MSQAFPEITRIGGQPAAKRRRSDLHVTFERMHEASRRWPTPTYEQRMSRLERMADLVHDRQDDIADAIRRDFGNRAVAETKLMEVMILLDHIKYVRKHLRSWMRPDRRHVSLTYQPARAAVHLQPLGVVGIIGPWNYPVHLALMPAVAALAAGNRVLIKPSEYTPETAELLQAMCDDTFEADVLSVVTGGPEVGEAFARLPFDHILFTGSTHVGRLVMKAAADHLVPVTLELGGKSPTIVHDAYPVDRAAERIAWGKCINAGQTCIAPDYLLVPEDKLDAYVEALSREMRRSYPTLADNPDYTSIVNPRHYGRVLGLIDDAVARGARKLEINPAGEPLPAEGRKIAPTILTEVTDKMRVMQEEIFGPVLPIMTYATIDDAIAYVNDHPRPLALYYFDDDRRRAEALLERTMSGGGAINEVMVQTGIDDMPFGGVGPSGMGLYHGREGFETFSHKRSVLYQAKWNATALLKPPYGMRMDRMLKLLIGRSERHSA